MSFIHILPCIICKEHYSDIIYKINPLIEEDITRKYIIKWVYNTHNIVNEYIDKPKYNYKKFINNFSIKHNDIFFILSSIYSNFNYESLSIHKYDQIYNFFIYFCLLYPDKDKKKKLKNLLKKDDFKNIILPKDFHIWFTSNLNNIKNIICV